jgi:hypothetical protein
MSALALEVVVEHRLVHRAADDTVDAGAGEPALGELEGGDVEVRSARRGSAHMKPTVG